MGTDYRPGILTPVRWRSGGRLADGPKSPLGADRGNRRPTVLDECELLRNQRNDLVDRFHGLAGLVFSVSQVAEL
jgi:hypothetical protein